MSRRSGITVLVHTRESAAVVPRLLATTEWADERIVVDMHSEDGTRELALAAGCRVIDIDVEPFTDGLRNRFLAEPAFDWTLVLDSDEYLADDAGPSLRGCTADAPADVVGFVIPRRNEIAGRVLRGSGWYPDGQTRLFRTDGLRYSTAHHVVPAPVDPAGRIVPLPLDGVHIHHRNYGSIVEFLERQLRYAVTDTYDEDPRSFDFDRTLVEARREFDTRFDPEHDGSMSYALSIAMYCNVLQRGLVHWERLGHRPPLPDDFGTPSFRPPTPATPAPARDERDVEKIRELEEAVVSLSGQLEAIERSRTMRLLAPVRRLRAILRP